MNYGFRNSLPPMSADVIMSRWFQSTPQKSSHETNDQLQRQYYLRFLEIFYYPTGGTLVSWFCSTLTQNQLPFCATWEILDVELEHGPQ